MTSVFAFAFGVFGAVLASFICVVGERLYTGQQWWNGRSRCNSCRRPLSALDLVPIISWLISAGRCRTCGARIPLFYTLFEATLALLFALSYLRFGLSLELVPLLLALCVLGFIVVYDLRHTVIPFWSSVSLVALALLFDVMRPSSVPEFLLVVGTATLIGFGFFMFYLLSRGRAMGLGDVPVAFALSLIAGREALAGFVFSFWIGAVVGIVILVRRQGGPTMGIEVPFAPFMAAGFLLALFTKWNPFLF